MINRPSCPVRAMASVVVLALTCCEAPQRAAEGGLGVQAIQFQDMAVPAGMNLRDSYHQSHSREMPGWRYGHYEYGGQPPIAPASAYVLDRMPQHKWSLESDERPDENTRNLRFRRGSYTVDYSFQRSEGRTLMIVDYRTNPPELEPTGG